VEDSKAPEILRRSLAVDCLCDEHPWNVAVRAAGLDKTYGHLLPDVAEHVRGLLDAFDARERSGIDAVPARA
jgi:hypothetical protein